MVDGLERFQLLIEALDGQAHHVEVAAADVFHGHHANPFLDAVGSGLVQGLSALGIAADVYYENDKTKYSAEEGHTDTDTAAAASSRTPHKKTLTHGKPGRKATIAWLSDLSKDPQMVKANYNITEEDFPAISKAAGRPP